MDDDKAFYQAVLGITRSIPSEETLRQRMNDIGDSLRETILNENVELLISNKIQPTALPNGFVSVDIDVTPMDNSKSNKEGVSLTYKGFDGYAPMMAYIGTEGYAINFELREGKQHCQNGTVEFLQETIRLCLLRESKEGWFEMTKQYYKSLTIPRESKKIHCLKPFPLF